MTTLHKFLTFNERCPLCNNPLTLYMQWIDANLYIAREAESGVYYFTDYWFNNDEHDLSDHEMQSMTLMDYRDRFDISFSHTSLFNEAKKYQIYFYFLCKNEGFRSKNLKNYEINLAKGCYYRSTPLMEFKKETDSWKLGYTIEESSDLVNKDESFCLKARKEGLDKFYLLSRDMETQTTKVWYFTMTDKQRVDKTFRPDIFQKELPLIARPSMDNKNKILERINSWIVLS